MDSLEQFKIAALVSVVGSVNNIDRDVRELSGFHAPLVELP